MTAGRAPPFFVENTAATPLKPAANALHACASSYLQNNADMKMRAAQGVKHHQNMI